MTEQTKPCDDNPEWGKKIKGINGVRMTVIDKKVRDGVFNQE